MKCNFHYIKITLTEKKNQLKSFKILNQAKI